MHANRYNTYLWLEFSGVLAWGGGGETAATVATSAVTRVWPTLTFMANFQTFLEFRLRRSVLIAYNVIQNCIQLEVGGLRMQLIIFKIRG